MNSPKTLPALSDQKNKQKLLKKNFSSFPNLSPEPITLEKQSHQLSLSPVPIQRLDFFDSFKNLSKVSSKQQKQLSDTPHLAYLDDLHKNNLQPKPFGMSPAHDQQKIDLRLFSIGDSYAHAFSEGLKHFRTLESLNLRSNRLSEKGAYQILSNLQYHPVRYLSLNDNLLGDKSFECILSILRSPKPYLKHLKLENTRISAAAISSLASVLCTNKSLVYLSLAKNNLSSMCCKALREMLHYNEKLKSLDLHWNCIKGEGALWIFEGIIDNNTLEELDLSWNAIGSDKGNEYFGKISSILSNQEYLKHLDISYNYISTTDAQVLGKALEANHSLLGLHLSGNECELDPRGFLIPKTQTLIEQSHLYSRMIDSPKFLHKKKVNCWVCEDWKEIEFRLKDSRNDPIFLHLDIDGYRPEMMFKRSDCLYMVRAVPCDDLKFFFSINGKAFVSKEYKTSDLQEALEMDFEFWKGFSGTINLDCVNVFTFKNDSGFYQDICNAKPREKYPKYIPPAEELIRVQWTLGMSVFKSYKFLTPKLLTDCFEFDWNLTKVPNLMKNQIQLTQLHDFLHDNYEGILVTYKRLSSLSSNEVFSISNFVLIDYLNDCQIIDSLYLVEDMGINWNSVISTKDKNLLYNPGNALVRFQFLEILVRIAMDRYVRNKLCSNIYDATRKLFNEMLLPSISKSISTWRQSSYLKEEVDLVYKSYKPILEGVFKKYSGRKSLPGQKNFMSLEEFRDVCIQGEIESENCGLKEIDLAFILAISVQVDEVFRKRHMEMNFVEFLEALGRVCEHNLSGNKLNEELEKKMPSLLKLCPVPLRDSFVFPTAETYYKMMYKQLSIKPSS